jgi:hypothetical protein
MNDLCGYRRDNPKSCVSLSKNLVQVRVCFKETPVALTDTEHIALVPEKLLHQQGALLSSR